MKKFATAVVLTVLLGASATASAWWGPWGGWGPWSDRGWGDDWWGDGWFDFNLSAGGGGRYWDRYYDYWGPWGHPYGGWGYPYAPPYVVPVVPQAPATSESK